MFSVQSSTVTVVKIFDFKSNAEFNRALTPMLQIHLTEADKKVVTSVQNVALEANRGIHIW